MKQNCEIFLSYSLEDTEDARRVRSTLSKVGWRIWMNVSEVPGTLITPTVEQALAGAVTVLWSSHSTERTGAGVA